MNNVEPDFSRSNKKTNTTMDFVMLWFFDRLDLKKKRSYFKPTQWRSYTEDNSVMIHMLIRVNLPIRRFAFRSDVEIEHPINPKTNMNE